MSKLHALHNEKACDLLLETNEFNDWVTTTAFYSALHFVVNEIFPLNENGKQYINFQGYYNQVCIPKNMSKHKGIILLVKQYLSCHSQYRWLYDSCMSARYSNYIVSNEKASQSRNYLNTLKDLMIK